MTAPAANPPRRAGLRDWLSLVKFSHSIFALPFALQGAWIAARGVPTWRTLGLIMLCAVSARTAAMAFNRLVDRRIDALNPRTAGREIPAGKLAPAAVGVMVVFACAVFIAGAYALGPLAGNLAPLVLAVLLGYSLVKRVSWGAHLVLGLALALAPLGAWIAVRGELDAEVTAVIWLALAVWTWVAGFDLIYASQDAEFDRGAGLHSIPARFGIARALLVSRLLHVVTIGCLCAFWYDAELSWIYAAAIGGAACLLAWEQSLVRADDLSRVDMAFFTLNGWLGVALFVGLWLDLALLSATGHP